MLPLDLVDRDVDEVISAVENRIAILNSIDDPSVSHIKKEGLGFLMKEAESLRMVKKELEGAH
jgi:hypothetical protein